MMDIMMDILIVISIMLLAGIAFNYEARLQVRMRRVQQEFKSARDRGNDSYEHGQSDVTGTIELIGEEAYKKMTDRIDLILRTHGGQPSISLSLSCGPDSADGEEELHKMLPGDEVQLLLCCEEGVHWVDVYYNGFRVGRLALLGSEAVRDLLNACDIRAAYVAEQNCFGIEDSYDLRIIVFYEPKKREERSRQTAATEIRAASKGLEICEN